MWETRKRNTGNGKLEPRAGVEKRELGAGIGNGNWELKLGDGNWERKLETGVGKRELGKENMGVESELLLHKDYALL